MTNEQMIVTVGFFIGPIAFNRIRYRKNRRAFEVLSTLRVKSKLNLHHGHWGLPLVVFFALYLQFFPPNWITMIGTAYGVGLITDEIIAHLRSPGQEREKELEVYEKSEKPMYALAGAIVFILLILYIASHPSIAL